MATLLWKFGIPKGKRFDGFPVSGQFLVGDRELAENHRAKAAASAPPISVAHLNSRIIDGRRSLPPRSLRQLFAQVPEVRLVLGLNGSVRLDALRDILPDARMGDGCLSHADQRVQIIRKHPGKGGVLQFCIEVVSTSDGSIADLLGVSPGTSTVGAGMVEILPKCVGERLEHWSPKLEEILPAYGQKLVDDAALYLPVRDRSDQVFGLAP